MVIRGEVLVKGFEERTGKKKEDGTTPVYKQAYLFATDGKPMDFAAIVKDDRVEAQVHRHQFHRCEALLDLRLWDGKPIFELIELVPVNV